MRTKDYSKSLSVRMNDSQYDMLKRYLAISHHTKTLYFDKLISNEQLTAPSEEINQKLYTAVNMISSNIRQIVRHPRARQLDRDSVAALEFLNRTLSKEIEHLTDLE